MTLGNESAYTPSLADSLEAVKIAGPKAGAIAVLYFPELGRDAHAVWIESVRKDGRFVTIEGNTDVAGGRTGGRVMRKVRSPHNFTFFMPKYDEAPKPKPPYYGNCTKLQRALRLNPDNIWGPQTDKAAEAVRAASSRQFPFGVKFVQGVVGVKQDGAWGGVSRRALQKVILEAQNALIDMSHTRFPKTGVWDVPTDKAYQKVRKICRRP